jgi:heat shock protein HslJ
MRRTALGLVTGWALFMSNMAHAASELAGTTWRVESVKDVASIDPAKTRLSVDAEGRVSTTVGCNQMSGMATVTGSKLSFGPLASTRMACEPALMDLEQKYGIALDGTRSFRVEGMLLKLIDESGAELIRLSRAN